MDWSKVREPAARRPDPATPPLIATLFRLVGATGRPLRCATYRGVTGTELRLEYEDRDDDVLRSQLFKANNQEAIAETAAQWRAAFDGRGFRELAIG